MEDYLFWVTFLRIEEKKKHKITANMWHIEKIISSGSKRKLKKGNLYAHFIYDSIPFIQFHFYYFVMCIVVVVEGNAVWRDCDQQTDKQRNLLYVCIEIEDY